MDARVVAIDRRSVRCVATEMREHVRVGPRLVLCQCLPKGKKLDAIVRAATEIGVDAIHLVSSARSVPRPGEDRGGARTDRLRRIAEEATRQSLGTLVPTIHAPRPLAEVVRRAPPGACRLAFVPDAAGTLVGLGAADEAWVLIGPEGGLDPKEIDDAVEVGFLATRLFDTVLRVETAAPVALGMVRLAITR